jgi:hypothetical protein
MQAGTADCAHQAAAEDRTATAPRSAPGDHGEPVLEYGSGQRQVGGRAVVPHSDGCGPVHAGVYLPGSRSCDDGNKSGAGVGTSEGGTTEAASTLLLQKPHSGRPATPITIPTVASASAGASLTLSPTMATCPYRLASSRTFRDLVLWLQVGKTVAGLRWKSVQVTHRKPDRCKILRVFRGQKGNLSDQTHGDDL